MARLDVHFSSDDHAWETPRALFDYLDGEFEFNLDVCALPCNAKVNKFYTPEDDGLSKEWVGVCWMNPPYGRQISRWIQKAYEEAKKGATVVALIPARTDTRYWHEYVSKAEVRFLRGRIRFVGADAGAPFPSAIVVFRSGVNDSPVTKYIDIASEQSC